MSKPMPGASAPKDSWHDSSQAHAPVPDEPVLTVTSTTMCPLRDLSTAKLALVKKQARAEKARAVIIRLFRGSEDKLVIHLTPAHGVPNQQVPKLAFEPEMQTSHAHGCDTMQHSELVYTCQKDLGERVVEVSIEKIGTKTGI